MKKKLVAIAIAMSCGAAYAGPTELSYDEMDVITAGTSNHGGSSTAASGGAIVGNNSQADIVLTGAVEVGSEAQSGARALNLVNSSESTVANGVNIWNGSQTEPADVVQSNSITQEQRRVGSLPIYNRPEANTDETHSSVGSSSGTSSLAIVDDQKNTHSTLTTQNTTNNGEVDTVTEVIGQKIQSGRGLSASGKAEVHIDAGAVELTATGELFGGGPTATITLGIDLPTLDAAVDGSGCAVLGGSCTSEGTSSRSDSEVTDTSTLYTETSSSSSDESWNNNGSKSVRSAFEMYDAQAEYIVVDGSSVNSTSDYSVRLSGSAQSNMRALNAVNAAGSSVANGVNISRTSGGGATLMLSQTNVISHSR